MRSIEISSTSRDALTFWIFKGQLIYAGLNGCGGFSSKDFTGSTDKSLVVLIDGFCIEIPLTSNITTISEAVQILKYTLTTFKNTVNLNNRTNDVKMLLDLNWFVP